MQDTVMEPAPNSTNYEGGSQLRASGEARVSSMDLDLGASAPEGDFDAGLSKNCRSVEVKVEGLENRSRFSWVGDAGRVGREMEVRSVDVKEDYSGFERFGYQRKDLSASGADGQEDKDGLAQYNSLWSEFDDYVANEKSGAMGVAALSRALSNGFEVGDMVWGKVKSHPWWPGHIFNETFASASVRRTRREGHVLVAFFGDSSYGWFDPAELIPFDVNFAEKSRQTNSRNFMKAVEEAVDEANRRRGLGLTCKCRNPYNFRLTNVQGYYAVDVPEYEPGGIYSWNQIMKARDSFIPSETLSFVKQLALAPQDSELRSISFLNNKATIISYRKAVYEEFDETYAQAFGPPSRPSHDQATKLDQPVRQPPRAPLSGPLVIAEALDVGKSAARPMKMKDNSKKDKYLLKRRDEPSKPYNLQSTQGLGTSGSPSFFTGGSVEVGTEDYVLQKRMPEAPSVAQMPVTQEQRGSDSRDRGVLSPDAYGKETENMGQAPASGNLATRVINAGKDSLLEKVDVLNSGGVAGSRSTSFSDFSGEGRPPIPTDGAQPPQFNALGAVDVKHSEGGASKSFETIRQPAQSSSVVIEGLREPDVHTIPDVSVSSPAATKRPNGASTVGAIKKKIKVIKSPHGALNLDAQDMGEQKKKKKKAEFGSGVSSVHIQKQLGLGKVKPSQVLSGATQDLQTQHQKKVVSANKSSLSPGASLGNVESALLQLLSDLQALALDPFHGIERNCHATVRKFFLRFRSLVYQKSLASGPASEIESAEGRSLAKPPAGAGILGAPPREKIKDVPSSKPYKVIQRRDDPATKVGQKRQPSERQEEIAAKKLKKISDLKSLAAEKKAAQKPVFEPQRVEGRESVVPASSKLAVKQETIKRVEPSAKTVDPTMLVMKFPPRTSLPSLAELKARFARFGPIDQSGLRVFWKSSTCRVVFLHKPDAQAAYKYAVGNNSLFGNVSVRYFLRVVEAPATELSEPPKSQGEDNSGETIRPKDAGILGILPRPVSTPAHQPFPLLPTIQPKSILKKSSGDESGQAAGGGSSTKAAARVKFMLGGEESSRGEPLAVGNRNSNFNNASFADGGASSSVALDINSKNFQKVIPPPTLPSTTLPLLPSPPQIPKASFITPNLHHSEMALGNELSHITATPVDISQQMIGLLTRCSDIVTNVTGLLGYVPYHPL